MLLGVLARAARPMVCAKPSASIFRGYAQSSASRENRQRRVELAATYRAMEHYNLHEGACNHITALAPAADNSGREVMLLVPEGCHWSQVRYKWVDHSRLRRLYTTVLNGYLLFFIFASDNDDGNVFGIIGNLWRKPQMAGGFRPCDDVIKCKHFPRYWPFVWGAHRSLVNSPHKGQWRGALMFSLIGVWIKQLSKQSWGWSFETPSRPLWRHCNAQKGR